MSLTTSALRIALAAAALCAAGSTADAKPRRVVVLDFDGPRALADNGRSAIVNLLGEQYDVVATKRWIEARAAASRRAHGPQTWQKAAKTAGVDAVIEGWVQDEGRHKVLTMVVREASTGRELDPVSVRLGRDGIRDEALGDLRMTLDDVLDWIETGSEPTTELPVVTPRHMIGAKKPDDVDAARDDEDSDRRDRDDDDARDDDEDDDSDRSRRRSRRADRDRDDEDSDRRDRDDEDSDRRDRDDKEVAAATDADAKEANDLAVLFGEKSDEWPLPKKPTHVPRKTPLFQISAGGYYGSRSLDVESEDPQNYLGATSKGVSVSASVFPFPKQKLDGRLSGFGASFNLYKSPSSEVGVELEDAIAYYGIDYGGYDIAAHYRYPIGLVTISGEAGYSRDYYKFESDIELDVPDVDYEYFFGGGRVDLSVTNRASIGFGARFMYLTGTGDLSSLDWYGPGTASGLTLDGNVQVPLPKSLFIRGELKYRRIKSEFDAPDLSAEQALSATDSTVNGTLHLGVEF